MCAKHYENPTMLSRVTAKNVGDVFLRHTVDQIVCKYLDLRPKYIRKCNFKLTAQFYVRFVLAYNLLHGAIRHPAYQISTKIRQCTAELLRFDKFYLPSFQRADLQGHFLSDESIEVY